MLWQAIDSMRFGLMGGYVTVPDARAGQYWPPLLSPPSVPEALELDEIGRSLHYPRPSRRVVTAPALCSFLDRYAVSAVVMRLGHLVPRQGLVERSLVAALGAPRHFGTTALVWLPAGAASGSASGTSAGEPQWMCRRGSARLSSAPSAG
jgi:hypothetical protein